jgi:hypothetical protein
MMQEVLQRVERAGGTLSIDVDGGLLCDFPRGALTPELKAELRELKPQIIAHLEARARGAVDAAADILTLFPGAKVIARIYYRPMWEQFWQVIERHFPEGCDEERITRAAEINRQVMNEVGPAFYGLGHYINDRLDELWQRIPEDRREQWAQQIQVDDKKEQRQ